VESLKEFLAIHRSDEVEQGEQDWHKYVCAGQPCWEGLLNKDCAYSLDTIRAFD
jgi:hypothetical protein